MCYLCVFVIYLKVLALARFNNKTVKVVGNHHSPSDIACTDDYMISLKYMNKVLEVEIRIQSFHSSRFLLLKFCRNLTIQN